MELVPEPEKELESEPGSLENNMNEEEIYELISEEIDSSAMKKGLWTKAFSEADGDEKKAKSLYIKYRFNHYKLLK